MRYANLFDFWFDKRQRYVSLISLRMLNFFNSTLGYENWYCFISMKFGAEKKWIICRNFVAGVTKFCGYIKISSFVSKSGIQYLWQEQISVFKELLPIKVVAIENDYFLHPRFESHAYQRMNGFLYWRSFYRKKIWRIFYYISHELIVRVIPTWIWFHLFTIINFWASSHQLSYFF